MATATKQRDPRQAGWSYPSDGACADNIHRGVRYPWHEPYTGSHPAKCVRCGEVEPRSGIDVRIFVQAGEPFDFDGSTTPAPVRKSVLDLVYAGEDYGAVTGPDGLIYRWIRTH